MLQGSNDVLQMFKDGSLQLDGQRVYTGGLCGCGEDEDETYVCPSCGLIWTEYIFMCFTDWCCRCGTVMVGDLADPEIPAMDTLRHFAARVSVDDYGCEPPDYDKEPDEYNYECDLVEEGVHAEYLATGALPPWLLEAMERHGAFLVGTDLWIPEEFCIF